MSRGHSASRRRNYGQRQRDIRRRGIPEMPVDLEGPDAWPRGAGWDGGNGRDPDFSGGARSSDRGGYR